MAWGLGSITDAQYSLVRTAIGMHGFPDKAAMLSQNKHRSLFINLFLTKSLGAVCQAAGKSHNSRSRTCGTKTVRFSGSVVASLP